MPRIPRNLILDNNYQTHKVWRGHNKEWNISTSEEKLAYIDLLNKLLPKQLNELNAFTLMSNHTHELFDINDKSQFSDLMRNHHSRYGMFFNKKHSRLGKVAYDRPKTCLIENDEYSMRATLYIHANPIRAGIIKNASNYKWSTHKLYAFGKRESFMKYVKFPNWYMELGKTWEERRSKYRKLFDLYLRENGLLIQNFLNRNFYGNTLWMLDLSKKVSNWVKTRSKSPP